MHPLQDTRESFARLSTDAGNQIEWHVEPNLGHSEESLNEQRYVAYWTARATQSTRAAVGPQVVDSLRRALVVKLMRHSPQPPPGSPGDRPDSARSARGRRLSGSPRGSPRRSPRSLAHRAKPTGWTPAAHPHMREPEWRYRRSPVFTPGEGEWNDRPMDGLGPPISRWLEGLAVDARLKGGSRSPSASPPHRPQSARTHAGSPRRHVHDELPRRPNSAQVVPQRTAQYARGTYEHELPADDWREAPADDAAMMAVDDEAERAPLYQPSTAVRPGSAHHRRHSPQRTVSDTDPLGLQPPGSTLFVN